MSAGGEGTVRAGCQAARCAGVSRVARVSLRWRFTQTGEGRVPCCQSDLNCGNFQQSRWSQGQARKDLPVIQLT